MTTAFSPILYLPMLSLSTASNFYFNKISSSYSLSPFINGHKFNLLSVKYSKFSYYLSNVIRINGEEPANPPFTPIFNKSCEIYNIENTTIQIIGCVYGHNRNTSIYSKNADLSIFICDFENCISEGSGGGIYHENGYFRTDSNNFIHCRASQYGGGFYHKTGSIKIYRSSFNFNIAPPKGGSQFCVENYEERSLFMDYCFFSYLTAPEYEDLIRIRPSENTKKDVLVTPRFCRFNFTKEDLIKYVEGNYTELVIERDEEEDTNKFYPQDKFPGSIFPMRTNRSNTFTPTRFFSPTEYFTQSTFFTKSDCFTLSANFVDSSPFTPSTNFSNSHAFTSSSGFSSTIAFTLSIDFTHSQVFSQSSKFSQSNNFLPSSQFSSSSAFTSSSVFTLSDSFTPHPTRTPSYTPIPTRSPLPTTPAFTGSQSFTASDFFTASNGFPASNFFPTDYFGAARAATKKPLKGGSIMILLIVLGALLLLLGLIANIILCVQMVQAGEIIITQRM